MKIRWFFLLAFVAIFGFFFVTEANAQGVQLEGKITLQSDGSPVDGAEVIWSSTSAGRPARRVKTKADGTYYIGFAQFGSYKVKIVKQGFMMHTLSIKVITRANQVVFENQGEVGPKQEMPEFTFQPGVRVQCDVSLVPESFYSGFISGPEAAALNEKITEASNLTQAGKYEESDKLLDEVIARMPKAPGPYYLKGINANAQGKFPEAETFLLKANEIDPKLSGLAFQLGSTYYGMKQKEKALEWFDKELARDPEIREVWINKAICFGDLGRTEEALSTWEKILAKWPTEGAAYGEMANLLLSLGQDEKAIAVLTKMEEVAKPDPKLWYNIAANFANRDQSEQAEKAFRKALEIDPAFPEPYRQLGFLVLSGTTEDYSKAISCFEKYLELAPNAEDAGDIKEILAKLKTKLQEKPTAPAPTKSKSAPGAKK